MMCSIVSGTTCHQGLQIQQLVCACEQRTLQIRASFHGTDSLCLLCKQVPETIEHFLLSCQELQIVRNYHMQQLYEAVVHCYSEAVWKNIQDQELTVQLIMDCTADGIFPTPPSCVQLGKLESASRRYCYALHWLRKRLTDENGL